MFPVHLVARTVLVASLLIVSSTAMVAAAPGIAKGTVNLRSGPGTAYARIATIPHGARVDVLSCARWCEVVYRGYRGWASAAYIAQQTAPPPRARQRGYFVFPDRSQCHGPEVWSRPWCENPLERSLREFSHTPSRHHHRRR